MALEKGLGLKDIFQQNGKCTKISFYHSIPSFKQLTLFFKTGNLSLCWSALQRIPQLMLT